MKKTLLSIAAGLLTVSAMNAQSLVLKAHDRVLSNGDRVNITSYWDNDADYFNPEITLTSATGGNVTATTKFTKSECSPALKLDEDGFDYQYGIGNPSVMMCSFSLCQTVSPGKEVTQTGSVEANEPHNMMIELTYNVGYDDPGIENKEIEAEFTLTVEQGSEKIEVTFYVDKTAAGIEGISCDSDIPATYYDLHGRIVTNPGNGIYIMRKGNKVSKVIL